MKLGESVSFIHKNVPGFAENIASKITHFFQRLEAGLPYFRTNWILVAQADLNPLHFDLDGERAADGALPIEPISNTAPEHLYLRVERQGIARLPRSQYILFSLHTYNDPLQSLV